MDISVPLLRSSKLYPVEAFAERLGASGIVALCVGDMMLPLATATFGVLVDVIFLHICKSSRVR